MTARISLILGKRAVIDRAYRCFFTAQPPLLYQEGNCQPHIHTFYHPTAPARRIDRGGGSRCCDTARNADDLEEQVALQRVVERIWRAGDEPLVPSVLSDCVRALR